MEENVNLENDESVIVNSKKLNKKVPAENSSDEGKTKVISKKRIIYVDIDEEITSIFDKVKKIPHKEIYLMVPRRSAIFHSIINLKILKSKLTEIEKTLYIITQDSVGLKLSTQAGIKAFDQLEADLITIQNSSKKEAPETAIEASGNEKTDKDPRRMKSRKLSIVELLQVSRDAAKKFGITSPFTKIKSKLTEKSDTKLVIITPSKRAFSTLIVASIGLFILIAYFALPGATIELTTSPKVLQRSVNIVLADSERNASEISQNIERITATYPIKVNIEREIKYTSTGSYFQGANSSGMIKVINKSPNNWPLVADTRFQTADGLVFRIKQFVSVPGMKKVEKTREDGTTYTDIVPGEIEVMVVSDTEDAFGKIIGKRGNIGPSKFFVPGLSKVSQNLIYAESFTTFTGGTSDSKPKVTEEDINASKEKLLAYLKSEAVNKLKEEVEISNGQKNTSLRLMEDSFTIEFGEPKYIIPEGILNQELSEFTVAGSISATGIAYNFNEVMNVLKQELKMHKSPEKKLVHIYDQSFAYDIVDIDKKNKKIKITASIKGIEEFDIDPETENGRRLAKKIREHVIGKSKSDAISYIQNLPEVNKVEIKTWPAWAPNLPSIPDSIKIKVIQGEAVELENPNIES